MRKLTTLLMLCLGLVFASSAGAQNPSGVNNAELHGEYAFTFSGFSGGAGGSFGYSAVGRFTADGVGNLLNGELDSNGVVGGDALTGQRFTGTYAIGPDGRGVMTLDFAGGAGTAKFAFAMMANGNAQFVEFDASAGSGTIGSGSIEKADTSAYSTAKVSGDYAFGAVGADNVNNRAGIAGRFTANGAGGVSNATGDVNAYGTISSMTFTSANYTVSDAATGRGTMNMTFVFNGGAGNLNFVFYVVNTGKLMLMERDAVTTATPLLTGTVLRQQTPTGGFSRTSLSGNMVFYLTGLSLCTNVNAVVPKAVAGVINADGNGNFRLDYDENFCRTPNFVPGVAGTYSVTTTGRASIVTGAVHVLEGYLVSSNEGLFLGTDGNVLFGFGEAQQAGSLTNGQVAGAYAGLASTPAGPGVRIFSGEFTADGASPSGRINGAEDVGGMNGPTAGAAFSATYAISASPVNGRGSVTLTSGSGGNAIAYVISRLKFVIVPLNDPNPAIWLFEQSSTTTTAALSSVSLNPRAVVGGTQSSTGTVTLSGAAPAGGAQVALSSSNTAAARVPSSVTIAAGGTSATFTVSTSAVSASTSVTISGSYAGATRTASLTVNPAPVAPSITSQPSNQTVTAGKSATFTVGASGTAPLAYQWRKNGAVISGATSSSYTTPAATSADNGAQFTVVVSNSAGSVTSNPATLTVIALPILSSLTLNPSSVVGGTQSSTGRVTLSAPAPAGGSQVMLASSNTGAARVPASVTIPAGATSGTFTVNTSFVLLSTSSTISASYNGRTLTATLGVLL